MTELIAKAIQLAIKKTGKTKKQIAYEVLPSFFLDLIEKYLRVQVEGTEFLPKKGHGIIIANHSGFMGFDVMMMGHQVRKAINRIPRTIAHKLWFIKPEISVHAKAFGMVSATFENGLKLLNDKELLVLFPEGEEGNFKPSIYSYRLRRFRRGFVRLALMTGAPIIPSVVIGGEETHITLSQLRFANEMKVLIPIPLNFFPLPAKWKIKFFEPIYLEKNLELANDIEYVTKLTNKIRLDLQKKLHAELKQRKTIFV